MLTVRNVANLVPPYAPDVAYHGTSAALTEFGVRILEVQNILVLGHGLCGGVQSLLEGAPENARDFIAPWMSMADAARPLAMRCASPEERRQCCEHEVVKISLANLMTFPWIADAVRDGELALHGAWFDIRNGVLLLLQPDGSFRRPRLDSGRVQQIGAVIFGFCTSPLRWFSWRMPSDRVRSSFRVR